jgi:hypothetical protein
MLPIIPYCPRSGDTGGPPTVAPLSLPRRHPRKTARGSAPAGTGEGGGEAPVPLSRDRGPKIWASTRPGLAMASWRVAMAFNLDIARGEVVGVSIAVWNSFPAKDLR